MECVLTCVLCRFSLVRLSMTLWTVASQAPLSMGFSKQEYWSGLPFPPPGDLPNPGIEPRSPAWEVDALPLEPPGKPSPCEDKRHDTLESWDIAVMKRGGLQKSQPQARSALSTPAQTASS